MKEIIVGSIVQLKSGGPEMTVFHVNQVIGVNVVDCQWFVDGQILEKTFLKQVLAVK